MVQRVRIALTLAVVIALAPALAVAEPAARVFINGKPNAVFFNDGDSFRVLKGAYRGAKARLAGYNTLESHGAVHQWGRWTAKELYVIAKLATLKARQGTWHCTTDEKRDGYGRMLMWCRDLAIFQVRHGLAHAMSVRGPAKAVLLKAQALAQRERVGIWAHGIPAYVMTSVHSAEEDTRGRGTYNRLVSSGDGHSAKYWHETSYNECDNVCVRVRDFTDAEVKAAIAKLKSNGDLMAKLSGVTPKLLEGAVRHYARFGVVDNPFPDKLTRPLMLALHKIAKATFKGKSVIGSCMIHVAFKRRYGTGRAACLK